MDKKANTIESAEVVYIGMDWSRKFHVACLFSERGEEEFAQIEDSLPAILRWFKHVSERFGGARMAVCLENGPLSLIGALEQVPNLDVFLANPATAAKYRKTFTPSGDKSDNRDSSSLLDLILRHPDKIKKHVPVDPAARALEHYCRIRRKNVDRRTGLISSLQEVLRVYYPQACQLLEGNMACAMALAFLERWPDPSRLSRTRTKTLESFFHACGCRSTKKMNARLEVIRSNCAVAWPCEIIAACRLEMLGYIREIEVLNKTIEACEKALAEVTRQHQRAALFHSLPGAGANLAPRLLAAYLLVDPEDSLQMQTLSGIGPIRVQSGNSMKTFMRRHCGKFMRQSFHEFAGCSVRYSAWAKAYYQYQTRTMKKRSQAAKRALAYKWIRIITACWKNGTLYDENCYIESLQRRNSPLLPLIQQEKNKA